jgi:sulfotransferase family protein
MKNKPDFIFAGYPRTGSSWLFRQLIKHSEVFLPYCKEVDFYWGYDLPPKGDANYVKKRVRRYRNARLKNYRENIGDIFKWKRLLWDLRYIYGRRSQNWYHALFQRGKYCGDMTPNYAMISQREIRKLHSVLPDIKIIIGFREPIDQLWSILFQDLFMEKCDIENLPDETLRREIEKAIGAFPKYHECYENWASVIPSKQIYCYFFENAMSDPVAHYSAVCDFLGLEAQVSTISAKPVGNRAKPQLPAEYEKLLVDEFRESVEILHRDNRFELPSAWYNRYPYLHTN